MNDSDCVQVAVRIRPLVQSEIEKKCYKIIEKVENEPQVVVERKHSFTYNFVFDPSDTQENIYKRAVCGNLKKLFMGYNVTILAYGQTGSGKTHTMGTSLKGIKNKNIGVIPCSTYDIFKEIDVMSYEYVFTVKCSFIELYKEQLYDLLSRKKTIVGIKEDSNKEIKVQGVTEVTVTSAEEIIRCLSEGSARRAVGPTAMNKKSSRSHAIFTVSIQKTKISDPNSMVSSKFHLVDLAGSQRINKTQVAGCAFKEGVKINQGLFALEKVITTLTSSQTSRYVSYRTSKLTRLLQDSLGGNSITLMIACVSPANYNLEETLSTLKYADLTKRIKNKPVINQDPRSAKINQINKNSKDMIELQNSELDKKNHNLQQQLQITLNDVTDNNSQENAYSNFNQNGSQSNPSSLNFNDDKDVHRNVTEIGMSATSAEGANEIQELPESVKDVEKEIEKSKEESADHRAYSNFNQNGSQSNPSSLNFNDDNNIRRCDVTEIEMSATSAEEANEIQELPESVKDVEKEIEKSKEESADHRAYSNLNQDGSQSNPSSLNYNDNQINRNDVVEGEFITIRNTNPAHHYFSEFVKTCLLCAERLKMKRLVVPHYVKHHPNNEVMISRITQEYVNFIERGNDAKISNKKNSNCDYNAYCVFCEDDHNFSIKYWWEHFTMHTGEYLYECRGCRLKRPRKTELGSEHFKSECGKGGQRYTIRELYEFENSVSEIGAYICRLCYYIQLRRVNIERHLNNQHDINAPNEPLHIKEITLLRFPDLQRQ